MVEYVIGPSVKETMHQSAATAEMQASAICARLNAGDISVEEANQEFKNIFEGYASGITDKVAKDILRHVIRENMDDLLKVLNIKPPAPK